ncbi:pyridoxal phosphate-dependent aminotransferase [Methanochimaera problematica]|uniref:pyridoxal phosphate-dependent aminotransferase n=1 Tax=Methanochimaera problematica TaxID=2609417 RepID=UPI00293942B4|nr:histidinol-phosphate transaminase [Methanoplanus sp. FWC-SCC4]
MKSVFLSKVEHGGASQLCYAKHCKDVLDFSASLNPYPPDISWIPDMKLLLEYPDDSYYNLKKAIANTFGCPPEAVCVGNGSIEVIRTYFYATIEKNDFVRIDPHTFGEYSLSVQLAGGRCTVLDDVDSRVRIICNPNNPTGSILSSSELIEIARSLEESGKLLFIDEAFIDLADERQSMINKGISNVFVSRSLTKSFAVPGLRIGFGVGNPELIEKMEVIRPPWSVNAFAEDFAIKALENLDLLEKSCELIKKEKIWLYEQFERIGINYVPSAANYILLNIGADASLFSKKMLDKNIFVRDCTSFGLPRSIRVAVRTREENLILVEALEKCFQ